MSATVMITMEWTAPESNSNPRPLGPGNASLPLSFSSPQVAAADVTAEPGDVWTVEAGHWTSKLNGIVHAGTRT